MKEGFKNKVKNIKETKKKANCDKNGCPITHTQNAIYKLHVEYKPQRDKNHMLAHNTESGNFFYKQKDLLIFLSSDMEKKLNQRMH